MSESFVWVGPLGDRGGYGNVARNFVHGLVECGARVVGAPVGAVHPDIGAAEIEFLRSLPAEPTGEETVVVHADPSSARPLLEKVRGAHPGRVALCTIAETDRIPAAWASVCNEADEVWVPSTFNALTFARSGVALEKLRLVPYGIDPSAWPADGPVAAGVAPDDHFCFLYTFAFDWRKGFDLLLAAYLSEFTRDEKVTLVLKVYDPAPHLGRNLRAELAASVAPYVDLFRGDLPRVHVVDAPLDRDEIAALYRRADLYVSTDRANGWGMPCFESMAMGRPTATIDWSGSTEFMHEGTSVLFPPGELVPVDERLAAGRADYAGQRWPEVSVASVRERLRAAFAGEIDLAALGRQAREEVQDRWTTRASGAYAIGRDTGAYRPPAGLAERLRPLVGLGTARPLDEVRGNVLVAGFGPGESWGPALDAYVAAFGPGDDVSLCLWGDGEVDEHAIGAAVVRRLQDASVDVDAAPDLVVVAADPEEALVEPRVRALVGPADRWPAGKPRVAADPESLRRALDLPRPVVEL